MDRCPPLSWRAAIGHFPLISFEVLSISVETGSGRSLLMDGGLDRCDSDPIRLRHALRDLGRSSGAFSLRKVCSTISRVFQMTAVAFTTFMYRFAAAVRSRIAAKSHSRLRRPVWSRARIRT